MPERAEPIDAERDALQKAYNGLCGVEGRLLEAGWAESDLAHRIAGCRQELGKVAFDGD